MKDRYRCHDQQDYKPAHSDADRSLAEQEFGSHVAILHRDLQRCLAGTVAHVGIGTVGQEQCGDRRAVLLGGKVQGSVLRTIAGVDVGTAGEKQRRGGRAVLPGGYVQRGVVNVALGIDIGAAVEEQRGSGHTVALNRVVQGRVVPFVSHVDRDALVEKLRHGVGQIPRRCDMQRCGLITVLHSEVQWRLAVLAAQVGIGAPVQKELCGGGTAGITAAGNVVQRGPVVPVAGIDIGAAVKQQRRGGRFVIPGRVVQGSGTGTVPGVDIGTAIQEQVRRVRLGEVDRVVQGGLPLVVAGVDVGVTVQEQRGDGACIVPGCAVQREWRRCRGGH